MSKYPAPLKDINFILTHGVGFDKIGALPGCEEVTADLAEAILDEAVKFSANVLSPLNRSGDIEGAKWDQGKVTTPKGFKEAYWKYIEGGWSLLAGPAEYGGQGRPPTIAIPGSEMVGSANMAFKLCALLPKGAAEALGPQGSKNLQAPY